METENEFYYVFNPDSGVPHIKHATYIEACKEAERLTQKHQTPCKFYVLKAVAVFEKAFVVTNHSLAKQKKTTKK